MIPRIASGFTGLWPKQSIEANVLWSLYQHEGAGHTRAPSSLNPSPKAKNEKTPKP